MDLGSDGDIDADGDKINLKYGDAGQLSISNNTGEAGEIIFKNHTDGKNFVFQDDLPKLDILTSLDKFVLLSYIFCAIPIFTTIFFNNDTFVFNFYKLFLPWLL